MSSLTGHALERIAQRIGIELDSKICAEIVAKANMIAKTSTCDMAARLYRMHAQIGKAWSNTSNGDTIIAIIRRGQVQTFMFRRSTQPHTPDAYRVAKVIG